MNDSESMLTYRKEDRGSTLVASVCTDSGKIKKLVPKIGTSLCSRYHPYSARIDNDTKQLSSHVQSYALHDNGGKPVKAYSCSALHLRDDFRTSPEHRLSPIADSL